MIARNTPQQIDFCLPDLGEGLEEAELIEWSVHVGQRVAENDILAKMETAKALVEVPSPRAGVIAILHGKPGDRIKVGAALVTFWEEPIAQQESPPQPGETLAPTTSAPATPSSTPSPGTPGESRGEGLVPDQSKPGNDAGRDSGSVVGDLSSAADETEGAKKLLAAPAVRRLARDLGVEIEHVTGTGVGGRITSRDVEAAAGMNRWEGGNAAKAVEPPSTEPTPHRPTASLPHPPSAIDGDTRIPFRGIRRTIAEHLRNSVAHAVHFTVMDEADVTALEDLRRRLVAASNEKISLLPFVASAVCRVLSGRLGAQFARLNSTVDDEHQEIVQHRAVHLGIATETENGLMVPVIRDAHRLGVLELSRLIAQIARSARDRALGPEQLTGSTFTISNYGSYAGRFGTPIINYPEVGILGIGRAREGVVVRSGMLGVGRLLPLSLAADHRVVDGATAASALAKMIELLQSPQELLPPGGNE